VKIAQDGGSRPGQGQVRLPLGGLEAASQAGRQSGPGPGRLGGLGLTQGPSPSLRSSSVRPRSLAHASRLSVFLLCCALLALAATALALVASLVWPVVALFWAYATWLSGVGSFSEELQRVYLVPHVAYVTFLRERLRSVAYAVAERPTGSC
jgi:hypothetical protein